ncbi:head-tail connector protein [Terrihalobacillus insolitus]|uniref:head-tail connector protein n=1 Tax=Terrihalobacillus insolitus TaxID=2950438 RepID=UPI002340C99C|nr:head-tail connector protein [Terrihalobacillus insolitus]MDC3414270.1 head-tail connector protein [Terrihalobacillus insolitus]
MPLTTLSDVKEYLQIDSTITDQDSVLTSLIKATSQAMENYCKRKLEKDTVIEEYDGTNSVNLYLKNFPIESITEITVDGVLVDSTTYKVRKGEGIVVRTDGHWPHGILNIQATYETGYVTPDQVNADSTLTRTLPYDLELACKHLVMFYYKTDISDFSSTFGEGVVMRPQAWPSQVRALLSAYKKVLI